MEKSIDELQLHGTNVLLVEIEDDDEEIRARKRAEYGFGEYGFKHRTQ